MMARLEHLLCNEHCNTNTVVKTESMVSIRDLIYTYRSCHFHPLSLIISAQLLVTSERTPNTLQEAVGSHVYFECDYRVRCRYDSL
jgi:hypothetical protein